MLTIEGYCAGCGHALHWVGSCNGSRYCCDGCLGGACTCGLGRPPAHADTREEGLRDVYRIA